jgi:PAS domain S-box-containing protein
MNAEVQTGSSPRSDGMAARIAALDWAATALGPRESWSPGLRAIIDLMLASPQPAWIAYGPDLLCLYNDAHVEVLGRKHPRALGRPLLETWAEMAEFIAPVMRAVLDGASLHFEDRPFVLEGRSGAPTAWFSYSHVPIRDPHGAVVGVWSVAIETTARVLAEQARLEAESRYRTLFDVATLDCIVVHERGRIVDANARVCERLGYTRDELCAMHVRDIQTEFEQASAEHLWASLVPGQPQTVMGRMRCRDGTSFPAEIQISLMHQDGRPYFVGIARDITERLRVSALSRRASEAETAARVRSEFLASMSHELRTPMNGVLGLAQLGHRESANDPVARTRFGQILECGKLLVTVINDVLDFSKIEAGKVAIESVTFDPSRVVASTLQLFEVAATRKGLTLSARVSPDVPRACLGDPTRLEQILVNLVSNGVKFTAAGSVTLTAARRGHDLEFAVTDSGIGIPSDEIERIFLPFEQGDGSFTRQYGGTGLGLAISRRLALLMKGSVSVESAPGVGSTFRFTMPLREGVAALDAPGSPPPTGTRRLEGVRVLAAEDDEFCAMVVRELLEAEGALVEIVGDGEAALARVERDPSSCDLLLTDVQMPRLDGLELTRRARRIAPSLPVIGQTAHALPESMERCRAAGMCAIVQKPFDLDTFVDVLSRHVLRRAPKPSAES